MPKMYVQMLFTRALHTAPLTFHKWSSLCHILLWHDRKNEKDHIIKKQYTEEKWVKNI